MALPTIYCKRAFELPRWFLQHSKINGNQSWFTLHDQLKTGGECKLLRWCCSWQCQGGVGSSGSEQLSCPTLKCHHKSVRSSSWKCFSHATKTIHKGSHHLSRRLSPDLLLPYLLELCPNKNISEEEDIKKFNIILEGKKTSFVVSFRTWVSCKAKGKQEQWAQMVSCTDSNLITWLMLRRC